MRRNMPAMPCANIGWKTRFMKINEAQKCTLPQNSFIIRPVIFGIPIINARKQRENRSRRHDVMEVRDDVISVVQMQVAEVEAERQPGQAADAEHRQERQREQHRRVEPDRTAPQAK